MSREKSIEKEPYYHGLLPREDVKIILVKNGDFLVRISEPSKGETRKYILSVMHDKFLEEAQAIKHFVIKNAANKWMIEKHSFDTIQQMVDHHLTRKEAIKDDAFILQPICRKKWELEHRQVTISKKLGEGAFGEVSMGTLILPKRTVKVAIKQAKLENMTKEQIREFMAEARIMRSFHGHPNVVKFYGVAVINEPLYLIMELASDGSLNNYIQKHNDLVLRTRNEMVLQAAWGLEYIHSKRFIHRDIATRNCLYGDGVVKISDFGMTRTGTNYQMTVSKRLPFRWLAVETLKTRSFSQKSDVWSFGVLCWEVYSNCAEPYGGMDAAKINEQLRVGFRLSFSSDVNAAVNKMIVTRCWSENPNDRLSMAEIASLLQREFGIERPNFDEIEKETMVEAETLATSRQKKSGNKKGDDVKHVAKNEK